MDKSYRSFTYRVTLGNGSYFGPDGYSKYYNRLSDNSIPSDEKYGLEQAREHLKEIQQTINDGKAPYAGITLYVERILTVIDRVEEHTYQPLNMWVLARVFRERGVQYRSFITPNGEWTSERETAIKFISKEDAYEFKKNNRVNNPFIPVYL